MDKIKITNLEVYCYHGVNKEENILGQKFLVSATLYTDIKKAAIHDDILESINYAEVCYDIKDIMENNTCKLIETIGEKIAQELLIKYKKINQILIEIKKPWAPILLPIESVSVEILRRWHKAYISLGSNMGDKALTLKKAIELISNDRKINVLKVSELIETKPVGYVEQDDFLNGCIEINTLLTPMELLNKLNEIENELGRVRTIRWGPRTLDLDILIYDDYIEDSEVLTIPHKEMANRKFVLEPLSMIAPNLIHPILKENINNLNKKVKE